jgi:hypothetical protein
LKPEMPLHGPWLEHDSRLLDDIVEAVEQACPLVMSDTTSPELKHDSALLMLGTIERLVREKDRETAYSMLPLNTRDTLAVCLGRSAVAEEKPSYAGVSNHRIRSEAEAIIQYVDSGASSKRVLIET